MRKPVLSFLFSAAFAFGQRPVEFTAKIGIPVTSSFQTGFYDFLATGLHQGSSATRRYTAGGGLAVRLPHGFGAEFDILSQRLGYDLNFTPNPAIPVVQTHTWTTANSWEMPLLGVYRFARLAHVAGGVAYRWSSGATTTGQCYPLASRYAGFCGSTTPAPQPPDGHLAARSSFAGMIGAGIEKRAGPVRFVPELRYTRWRADAGASGPPFDLRSNPNQIDFLLGINF